MGRLNELCMNPTLFFRSRWEIVVACVVFSLGFLSSSWGAVNVNYQSDPSEIAYGVSSVDLINSGSPSLLSMTDTGYTPLSNVYGTSTTAALNDGLPGIPISSGNSLSSGAFDLDGTWTSTFFLNGGYTINQIDTIASWQPARSSQAYTVWLRMVGSSTFTLLTSINYFVASDNSSRVVITDTTGPLGVNVDAIQFDFTTPVGSGASPESVYREIDVTGALTPIPEPSSLGLGALGAVALLLGRWRKR
jgi:hypothetical protein